MKIRAERRAGTGEATPPNVSLTPRQVQIMLLARDGQPSHEIAAWLCLTKRGVDYHFDKIYRKLGAKNRIEALKIAAERNLLPPASPPPT